MLYILGNICDKFDFLKSIYLRCFICFMFAFLLMLVLGNPFIKFLKSKNYDEKIRDDGPATHAAKEGTPTMGGLLMVSVFIVSNIICADIGNRHILLLFIITILFASLGFIDDYKKFTVNKNGLSGRKKLLGQGIIGLIVWLYVVKFGLTMSPSLDTSLIIPINSDWRINIGCIGMLIFTVVVLMGSSNSVNLTDGLDGLVIMPMVICSAILGTIAYFTGHVELSNHLQLFYIKGAGEIAVYLSGVVGGGLGFLWYNFYPAEVFMGDTGSLALGGILGVVAILLKQELLLPIIGGLFVIEALSVILQVESFKHRKKRIFRMAPLHHHFEKGGMAETKVTMRFWITSVMFGILALGLVRLRGLI